MAGPEPLLLGCDFTSSPSRRKPVVLAWGRPMPGGLQLLRLQTLTSLDAFAQCMAEPGPWVGGFDLPFGLPRVLVQALGWPLQWEDCVRHYASLQRAEIRDRFAAFCQARPVGGKFAHRATDGPAGSSPSMKWVNPPVAYMLHAGVPRLLDAGVHLPGLMPPPPVVDKVALEAYPGLLAREVLGTRSYKSDNRSNQTPERLIARKDLLSALERGQTRLGLRLKLSPLLHEQLVQDGSGDSLDATLALLQAGWASARYAQGDALYGLPATMDPLEGWIITVCA